MAKKAPGRDRPGLAFKQPSLFSHHFSSSPGTGTAQASSSAASSSPAPAMQRVRAAPTAANAVAGPSGTTNGIAAMSGVNGFGGRALGGTQSEPALGAAVAAAHDSDEDDDQETAASSSLGIAQGAAPRRSPRISPAAAISSLASTIKAGIVKKEESLSPSRAKLRSSGLLADIKPIISHDANGKGKGPITLEIEDSDEEGMRGQVLLAPSSASPSTRQRKQEAIKKRLTVGANGREELDLTLSSSPSRSPADDTDSDDEVILLSGANSRRNSPSRSSSRASSRGPKVGTKASSVAPPTSPSKGKARETTVETSPRISRLNSVGRSAPAVSSPLAKNAPTTPRKGAAGSATPVASAARTLRSTSKTQSLPNIAESSASPARGPFSPRLRAMAAVQPAPAINVTTATSSSPPRGLPQTANLAVLTTPPRNRAADGTSSALYSLPSSSKAPSARPSTPTQRAAFAALFAANRTPGGGPVYIREPSGSPLSSAGPTPKRPLSRNATWPASDSKAGSSVRAGSSSSVAGSKRKPRQPDFTIDAPPSITKIVDGKKVVVVLREKPKKAATASAKMRRPGQNPTSEWDGDEIMRDALASSGSDSDDDDVDDSFATAREGSPSPAKSRASIRKRKQRAVSPPPDEDKEGSKSDSKSSSAAGSDDSDAESDAEELAALMSRATQRRKDGETFGTATSPGAASTSTAPTTVSPAKPAAAAVDDVPRRSSRAHHAPTHYSPSRPSGSAAATSSTGAKVAKANLLGLQKRVEGPKGALGFERLIKEQRAKEAKGRGAKWMADLLADTDEEDKGSDSDASASSNLEDPSAAFKPLDANIVGRALASSDHDDSDDDLPKLTLAKNKGKVDKIEQLVREEHERERGKRQEGESRAQLKERTVWRDGVVKVHSLKTVVRAFDGEGWRGTVANVFKDAAARSSSFPSPVVFFSPLNKNGQGSPTDYPIVSSWLLSLICHPSTPSFLADRLSNLFHLIVKHAARKAALAQPTSPLLSAKSLFNILSDAGAKTEAEKQQANGTLGSSDLDSDDSLVASELLGTAKSVTLSTNDQREIVRRWCHVVQVLSGTTPRFLHDDDAVELAVFCVRLSLDPTSASLRPALRCTISALLDSMPADSPARNLVFRQLADIYRPTRPHLQFEMLQALPHDSSSNKSLHKWLATSLLMGEEPFAKLPAASTFSSSVFPFIRDLLFDPPASSAFGIDTSGDTAADMKLFEQAQILLLAVTDLGDEIHVAERKVETRKVLDEITGRLAHIDSRLRTDAKKGLLVERLRAKNLLLSLHQSVTFQLRRARGQKGGGFGFSDEKDEVEKEVRRERKRKREEEERERAVKEKGRDGLKQARLSFGVPAAKEVEVNGAVASMEQDKKEAAPIPMSDDDDNDLPAPSFL
ncbi:hypothetical protein JCM6882_000028 [Rhodosporidiobolus microsporus]